MNKTLKTMKKLFVSMALIAITASCTAAGNKQQTAAAGTHEEQAAAELPAAQSQQEPEYEEVIAPDFTLNDINGKPLALSSLRGKYVVLDFWGSWCPWCIKGFPKMKEYYEKYAGKFEILGIDCNDPESKWRAAVEQYELPWLHVYCPRDNMKLLEEYGIEGFPTKIIIGPKGQVVEQIVGEDPKFYTLLDSLFK